MAIIKKYNKKNNTTYVYDSVSYWDKEIKQPRSKRKLIGKIDPQTGEIVPTAGRGRKKMEQSSQTVKKQADVKVEDVNYSIDSLDEGKSREDIFRAYVECQRKLLETEAALAKAESTISQLTSEKKRCFQELEQVLKDFSC